MKNFPLLALLVCLFLAVSPATAQPPVLSYTLTVNPQDLSRVQVAMRLRGLPKTFHLAMARHFLAWQVEPSWKNVEGLEAVRGTITPEGDGLWRVNAPGGDVEIRYNIRLGARRYVGQVQRPFLTPTGGLFGDLQMFMFVVEAPQSAAHVMLDLPPDWKLSAGEKFSTQRSKSSRPPGLSLLSGNYPIERNDKRRFLLVGTQVKEGWRSRSGYFAQVGSISIFQRNRQ